MVVQFNGYTDVAIIGNGISGVTFAREYRKSSQQSISIISKETKHFFSRTALMYIYMGHLKFEQTKPYEDFFWAENNLDLLQDTVVHIDFTQKQIYLLSGKVLRYRILVLALGSKPNLPTWSERPLKGVQGLYSYQDLQSMEEFTSHIHHAVVAGGGLIGVEMVEMLLSRNISVTYLVREKYYWQSILPPEEAALIDEQFKRHHVKVWYGEEISQLLGNEQGRVCQVTTKTGKIIKSDFVGVAIGVNPNIDFLKNSAHPSNPENKPILELGRGVLVNSYFATSVPDVYAIGDCAEFRNPLPGRRPVEQVWYTGKMHGEQLAKNLASSSPMSSHTSPNMKPSKDISHLKKLESDGDFPSLLEKENLVTDTEFKKPYDPGVWWNSAKFFDLEYQTYGEVPAIITSPYQSFFWKSKKSAKALRIVYDERNQQVKGFNFFGLRGRHRVCEEWIQNKATLAEVLSNSGAMNFDPEFFETYESDWIERYNHQFPQNTIKLQSKKGLFSSFFQTQKKGAR